MKYARINSVTLHAIRFGIVIVILCCIFVILIARLAKLQIIAPERLQHEGDLRSLRIAAIDTARGMILDRNHEQLAISVPAMAVWADPKEIHSQDDFQDFRRWEALAKVLELPFQVLREKVADATKRFVYLERQVRPEVAEYIKNLRLPGVYLRSESRRFYPGGETTAHVIGLTDIDDQGIEGVEQSFNERLRPEPQRHRVRKDALGRIIETLEVTQAGKLADNLQLSLDQRIQSLAYHTLKKASVHHQASSASLVLLHAKTGEILAMANTPSYNPNNRRQYASFRARNRAVTDAYELGSIMKPFIIASALDYGLVEADSVIDTSPGWMRVSGKRLQDSHAYGPLSLADILKYSSNIGMVRLALNTGPQRLLSTLSAFGLGQTCDIELQGQIHGYLVKRPYWSDIEIAALSFGYGYTLTALQLARAYAILANRGRKVPLTLLKIAKPIASEPVISAPVAKSVLKMLETVVEGQGTGRRAQVKGYRIAGKTGTAKKAVAGGYGNDYVASFAGIAPASDPQLVLVVLINEPKGERYYGGEVAAPVFAEVMSGALQLLNIRPDDIAADQIKVARIRKDDASHS